MTATADRDVCHIEHVVREKGTGGKMNKLGAKLKLGHGFSALADARKTKVSRELADAFKALGNIVIVQAREQVELLYAIEDTKTSGCGSGHLEEAAVIRSLVDRVCQLSAKNDALEARVAKLEAAGSPRDPSDTRRE